MELLCAGRRTRRSPNQLGLPLGDEILEANREAVVATEPAVVTSEALGNVRVENAGHRRIEAVDRKHDRVFNRGGLAEVAMQPMPAIHLAEVMGFGDDDVARIAIDEVAAAPCVISVCSLSSEISARQAAMQVSPVRRHDVGNDRQPRPSIRAVFWTF